MHALQEEHSDLLGLLAQQEIEFGVLRHVMTATLGSTAVADADSKAQKLAIKKYGSYTCYRNDEDLEIGYEVDQLSPWIAFSG